MGSRVKGFTEMCSGSEAGSHLRLIDFVCHSRVKGFTEMCSGSEAGSHLRLIDFVYHSTRGLRVIKKKTFRVEAGGDT